MSSYVQQHLMKDEDVIFQTRLHWIIFVPWLVGSVAVLSLLFFAREHALYVFVIRVVAAFLLFKAVSANLVYWTAEYGITTNRVLGKTGLVRIQSLDILLLKVEAVRLRQGVLGRILNYGDVLVTGTGGTTETLYDLPDPMYVRKVIQTQANRVHAEMSGSAASRGG